MVVAADGRASVREGHDVAGQAGCCWATGGGCGFGAGAARLGGGRGAAGLPRDGYVNEWFCNIRISSSTYAILARKSVLRVRVSDHKPTRPRRSQQASRTHPSWDTHSEAAERDAWAPIPVRCVIMSRKRWTFCIW